MKSNQKIETIIILIENILYGGTTTHLINLLNSDQFKKKQFIILTNRNNQAIRQIKKDVKNNNFNFCYYDSFNISLSKFLPFRIIFIIFKPILFLISIFQMYFILKKLNYDLLFAVCGGYGDFRSETAGLIASRLLKFKNNFFLIHHNYTKPILWRSIVLFFDKIASKGIKYFIFTNNATKKSIINNSKIADISKSKIKIIRNGVSLSKIKYEKIKILSSKKKKIKIGMLSRIEKYKGHEDMIDGISILTPNVKKNFLVYFIGKGEKKFINHLKKKIIQKGLNNQVIFLDYINADSRLILKNLDLLVSLTRDFESFGYSLAESMLVGTPVLTTDAGGISEYLNNNNSYLIKPKDTKQLSKSLVDFYYNRHLWKKRAKVGKSLIKKKFNSNIMSKNFLYLFRK